MDIIMCPCCKKEIKIDYSKASGVFSCPYCSGRIDTSVVKPIIKNEDSSKATTGANVFAWLIMSAIVFGIAYVFSEAFPLIWVFAIFFALVLIPMAIIDNENKTALRASQKESQRDFIAKNHIHISRQYNYSDSLNTTHIDFIVDDMNKNICLAKSSSTFQIIPFSEIIGCEILTDSQVTGGIKRAVVGGILAGEVDSIVGVATAKPHIMSYKIVLYRNQVSSPKFEINLITKKTATKDKDYIKAVEFAENISTTIKAIVSI